MVLVEVEYPTVFLGSLRSSRLEMLSKKAALKHFAKLTEKHLQ